jgi:hypothetical protein
MIFLVPAALINGESRIAQVGMPTRMRHCTYSKTEECLGIEFRSIDESDTFNCSHPNMITTRETHNSTTKELMIPHVTMENAGSYFCVGSTQKDALVVYNVSCQDTQCAIEFSPMSIAIYPTSLMCDNGRYIYREVALTNFSFVNDDDYQSCRFRITFTDGTETSDVFDLPEAKGTTSDIDEPSFEEPGLRTRPLPTRPVTSAATRVGSLLRPADILRVISKSLMSWIPV